MGRALILLFPMTKSGSGETIVRDQITLDYCDQNFLDVFREVELKTGIDCAREGISVHNVRSSNNIKKSPLADPDYGRVKSVLAKDLIVALKKYPKNKLDWSFKACIAFIKNHPKNWPIYLYWN